MNNIIKYYYGIIVFDIFEIKNGYCFNYNNCSYIFTKLDRNINEIDSIYKLYLELIKRNIFINNIVLNKDNQVITIVNNVPYVLVKDNTDNRPVSINDILYLQNNSLNIINEKNLNRSNWADLWKIKIDFYESKVDDLSRKNPLIYESIDYYIGLGENAISYLINNNISVKEYVLSHKRINVEDGIFSFYNPLNIILDSRVRDFTEYVKELFFKDKINQELFFNYLEYLSYSKEEYILLISRLLYPSYYFDLIDEIIVDNDESKIKKVLSKNNDYILFLKNTFYYIIYKKRINIPIIEWIVKFQD